MAVAVTTDTFLDDPTDRIDVTITGLGLGDSVLTLWRMWGDQREPVPGYRRFTAVDSTFVTDFFAPLQQPVTYEVEVLSGPDGPSRTTSTPAVLESTTGWLMDPLIPSTAVPVVGKRKDNGDIYLVGDALAALEYQADIELFNVMGSSKPMALFGQRMAEKGIDTSVGLRSADQNARLKDLLESTAQLVFRPLPEWGELHLNGVLHLANPVARQLPMNVLIGGDVTWWDLKSDVVAAPTVRVLTATWTYGDVEIMISTYQQKQDLMAGKTYLDDLKSPIG
jgi:hypothetical protein